MRSNRSIAKQEIQELVRSGFCDAKRIAQIVFQDLFGPGEIDAAWVKRHVAEAIKAKRAEETDWEEVTDCDRLDRAFEVLNGRKLIAIQNSGYEQSDGITEVTEIYHEAGAERSGIIGYCFCHWQDVEGVLKYGDLYLTFGDIRGTDAVGIAVGQLIQKVLKEAGFKVKWDGSIQNRIVIKAMKWQRRGKE